MNQTAFVIVDMKNILTMIRSLLIALVFILVSTSLKSQDVITTPTFEQNEGLILRWNNNPSLDSTVALVTSIVSADDKVWILYNNEVSPTISEISDILLSFGAKLSNVSFIESKAENPWLGDYGPIPGYFYDNNGYNRHFTDTYYGNNQFPEADFIPLALASEFGFHYDKLPLQLDASNIQLDGIGRAYVGDNVLTDNPLLTKTQIIQALYTKLSLNDITILPSIPNCGGTRSDISRLVKFIDPESILVTSFPESTSYYQETENLADTLSKLFNDTGRKFKIYKLLAAPIDSGKYAISNLGKIGSYTTAIVLNNKVLVPKYGKSQDEAALNLYGQIYKGYDIHAIPAIDIAKMDGSLNRMATFIPQQELFRMRHSKITEAQQFQEEIWVNVFATTWNMIDSIQIYYRIHPETEFTVINSIGCCGGNSGYLSGFTATDTISYYIKAYSGSHTQTLPLAAPSANYIFWFDAYANLPSQKAESEVTIFPNPATDKIYLKPLNESTSIVSYALFNSNGKKIQQEQSEGINYISLSTSNPDGFYLLILTTDSGKQIVKPIIIQK